MLYTTRKVLVVVSLGFIIGGIEGLILEHFGVFLFIRLIIFLLTGVAIGCLYPLD